MKGAMGIHIPNQKAGSRLELPIEFPNRIEMTDFKYIRIIQNVYWIHTHIYIDIAHEIHKYFKVH